MPPHSPPHHDASVTDEPDASGRSRRAFLAAVGVGASVALTGCLGTENDPAPSSLDAWPPQTDADRVVLRSVYDGWLSWAEGRFEDAHGVSFRNWGSPVQWDHHSKETDPLSPVLNPIQDHVIDPVSDRLGNPGGSVDGPTRSIDVVDVRPGWLSAGVDNGFVEPLPVDRMPAWENVPERFRDGVHRQDGETYGVPTEALLTTLVYDTEVFDEPPDSWDVLWDQEFEGQIALGGSYWDLPQIAALATGQDPKAPDDWDAIRDAIEGLRQQDARRTWREETIEQFQAGDAVVGTMWQPMVYRARTEHGLAVDYAVPGEGSVYKCYYHLVPTDAPNPMAAVTLVNWLTRPEAAAAMFERETVVPAAGVGDHLPDDVASFVAWDDDWTLSPIFPLADDVSVRYSEILRDVF